MKQPLLPAFAVVSALIMLGCEKPEGGSSSVESLNGAPVVAEASPQDGVFVMYGGYTNLVLELKGNRFRYWWESDCKSSDDPDYPLEGRYETTESTIRLSHPGIRGRPQEWRFRSINGVVTLWSKEADDFNPVSHRLIDDGRPQYFLQTFEEFLKTGTGANVGGTILVPTGISGEDAWRVFSSMSCEEFANLPPDQICNRDDHFWKKD